MSEPAELPEADLDSQLRGLFHEAEQKIQGRTVPKPDAEREAARPAEATAKSPVSSQPVQPMRPMMLALEAISRSTGERLEAISRATGENAQVLQRIDKAQGDAIDANRDLPKLISGLEALLEQKNGVNQRMFDALHEELKDYKDGFLLEKILKPVIRDLISLYDDLTMIHRQMEECALEGAVQWDGLGPVAEKLRHMEKNVAHHCEFVLEILARLDVSLMPVGTGRLDKQQQRAVALELVEDPELDMTVVRTVKRGFMWKERVLRAEEVVMNKCKQPPTSTPA